MVDGEYGSVYFYLFYKVHYLICVSPASLISLSKTIRCEFNNLLDPRFQIGAIVDVLFVFNLKIVGDLMVKRSGFHADMYLQRV